MASKSNPKRLRLNNHKRKQFRKHLQQKWLKKDSWLQTLNFNFEILKYLETQRSLNRTWDSTLLGKPTELLYQESLVVQLFLKKYLSLIFLKFGYCNFKNQFEFKENVLSIEIHVYPLIITRSSTILNQISQQIIHFRQLFTRLHCNVQIIDYFTLLNSHSKHLSFRRQRAEKFQLLPYRKFANQQRIFQHRNAFCLIRNAKLLADCIAFELSQVNKQHLNCLNNFQKSLESFWLLHQQIPNGHTQPGFSCFSQPLTGLRVQVKGRLNGQDRKQKWGFSLGCLRLQKLENHVDFSKSESFGLSGVLGVKVWISFKG